jgi:putative NIF3 family GTP cyclohydrolase 1 type 2
MVAICATETLVSIYRAQKRPKIDVFIAVETSNITYVLPESSVITIRGLDHYF